MGPITMKLPKMHVFILLFFVAALMQSSRPAHGLSLEEAVDMALNRNPGLQEKRLNKSVAETDLSEKKASNFGRIGFVSSYGHYNMPRTLAPLTPANILSDPYAVPTTQDLFTTGVMYEVPLFTGFSQQRTVEMANMQKEMAGVALKLSEEQLIYNVKTLYVNTLALGHQLRAQQAYVKALKALLADLQHEVKLGKKARVDILKAAADLEKARAQESRINSSLTIVSATLEGLLNLSVLPDLQEVPEGPNPSKAFNTDVAIKNSGRYQYAVMEVAKNAKQVEKSKSAYYPQVTFNAFYGQNFGPNDSSNRYSGDWNSQEIWQTVVTLTWNIFDFGARESAAQKARIQKMQSEKKKQTTALELKTALVEARTKIQTAIREYKSAEAEEQMTRETETIERVRFDNGAVSVNDLLYAKARHQQAAARLISARYACLSSRFYLDYLLEKGKPS